MKTVFIASKTVHIYLFIYLLVSPPLLIYLFVYLFIYLFIYLLISPPLLIYLFVYLFIYSFIYLLVSPPLLIYLFVYIFIHLFIYLLVSPLLLTHCSCRGSLLQLTLSDTGTLCRTPLDYRSSRPKDLYLTTHYNRKRQTAMPLA